MLVDTHAHLFWDSFKEDFDDVIQRSVDAGVEVVINVGVDVELSRVASQLENDKIKIYSSIAIHPEGAIRYFNNESKIEQDISELEKIYLSNPNKVIAIGECGLDFAYFKWDDYLPKDISIEQAKNLQRKLLQAQIDLAKKHNLPLLLHVRDDRSENPELIECWDEIFEMAGDHFGILHCYSGLGKTTRRAMDSNFLVSFAGNLTYKKNEYLKDAVKLLPLEKIVLETDCPFLPPQSIRGKRNEPSSVKEIAELIAEIKGVTFEEVATQTTQNFKWLFDLK
jgi:TatD DNase family protein